MVSIARAFGRIKAEPLKRLHGELIEQVNQQGASVTPTAIDEEARVVSPGTQQAPDVDPRLFADAGLYDLTSVRHRFAAYPGPNAIAATATIPTL